MFIVYKVTYYGELLTKYYLGSTSIKKYQNGYMGSVKSKKWKSIYYSELDELKAV